MGALLGEQLPCALYEGTDCRRPEELKSSVSTYLGVLAVNHVPDKSMPLVYGYFILLFATEMAKPQKSPASLNDVCLYNSTRVRLTYCEVADH
eukprot:scaffold3426_cov355-Prasinococcus_capsulatus_cf.AAC.11